MNNGQLEDLFAALAKSTFRSRFRLKEKETAYLRKLGLDGVVQHARELLATRLFPAEPRNDGKQTPMRGHPVFVAQHATATCCRKCLAKWHHIPRGRALDDDEQDYVLAVIEEWTRRQPVPPPDSVQHGQEQLSLLPRE
jgi:hypothetical protein